MTIELATILGGLLLLGGVAQLLYAFRVRKWGEIALALLRGLLYSAVGIVFITVPLRPAITAALLVIVLITSFRTLRKQFTLSALWLGARFAQHGSARSVRRLRSVGLTTVKACPPLRYILASNMMRAGVYRRGLVSEHLDRAGDQMEYLMQIMRAGYADSGVAERFRYDGSLRHLHDAHHAGHGVIVASPHLCSYPVFPRVLMDQVPCSIYLRRSASTGKRAINTAIGRAGEGHLVHPPDNASPSERLMIAMRILRERRALYITPDLPRKPDEGVPVTIFGRTVFLPTGVIIMAMRTRAPLVVALWHYNHDRYHIQFDEPMDFSARGNRQQRAAAGIRKFAQRMNEFLQEHPEMWWNWLDKRWTRILRRQTRTRNMTCP